MKPFKLNMAPFKGFRLLRAGLFRLRSMDDAFNGRRNTDLYVAYRSAFAAWASEVRTLQADLGDCVTTADGQERVRRRTRQTEYLYREKRNQLWESLAG